MARLTRARQQAHNRARVLAAAGEEFAERGFRDAKIDRIAERADLTRGAVYSNFPGKRALYFAVLADAAERADAPAVDPGTDPASALAAFARLRLSRVPLTEADDSLGTGAALTPEVLSDAPVRRAFAQLTRLDAILLGLALEDLAGDGRRRVRQAQAVLTVLHGAEATAATAPGVIDPFTVIRTCEHLAGLELDDTDPPPHLAHVGAAVRVDEPWSPPTGVDLLTREPVDPTVDGVVVVLGLERLEAVEDALRAAPGAVTAVIVTDAPAERGPLVRAVLADLRRCLSRAFPGRPRARLVLDDDGAIAAAAGADSVDDGTEFALRITDGRVSARSTERGAGYAVADTARPRTPGRARR
ncbi:TetR/AcrR family transcriptional regulator [Nocardiopsis lambiniae]|uniref:TetR family transcriptional regulator n=1 Tax=Nocardiopsis lambiniae TaxID=3075539 RepID=A0ABU2MCM6_9ACTN|nr:TetR family transcriptional regulator [Nocardiopsis sp. DSM 44743]MDT0330436.1 TetR family transcriptional regulator [Nocardiopsis sp. DSM 44743]